MAALLLRKPGGFYIPWKNLRGLEDRIADTSPMWCNAPPEFRHATCQTCQPISMRQIKWLMRVQVVLHCYSGAKRFPVVLWKPGWQLTCAARIHAATDGVLFGVALNLLMQAIRTPGTLLAEPINGRTRVVPYLARNRMALDSRENVEGRSGHHGAHKKRV